MSRVTEIRYIGYGVEDFEAERKFYSDDWGLIEVAAGLGQLSPVYGRVGRDTA